MIRHTPKTILGSSLDNHERTQCHQQAYAQKRHSSNNDLHTTLHSSTRDKNNLNYSAKANSQLFSRICGHVS